MTNNDEVEDLAHTATMQLPLSRPIGFRLDWQPHNPDEAPADLDLGCLYWTEGNRRGAVQSVRLASSTELEAPNRVMIDGETLIELGSDDETGDSAEGENLIVYRPDLLRFMVLFVSIYDGTTDFRRVGANITIRRSSQAVARAGLGSPDPGLTWCALVLMGRLNDTALLVHEERYFLSAYHADQHYGFRLSWGLGTKGT